MSLISLRVAEGVGASSAQRASSGRRGQIVGKVVSRRPAGRRARAGRARPRASPHNDANSS
eukprot:2986596-Heterocapsa_arctica.AAC.1